MKQKLTNADFCRAATTLKVPVAAVKAVSEIESRGSGFYTNDFPVILFERHKFRDFTGGIYNESHSRISGPAGNYGKGGQNQINKFNEAFALNPEAAMLSCSWGKFQIMGFNFKLCGYKSVGEFVGAMKESEGKQLDAFISFIVKNKLAKFLQTLNWAGFANGYNGAAYKKNAYDVKLEKAYLKFSKENVNCANLPITVAVPDTSTTTVKVTQTVATDESTKSETVEQTTENNPQVVDMPADKPYNGIGFMATLRNDLIAALGGNFTFQGLITGLQQLTGFPEWANRLLFILGIALFIFGGVWIIGRVIHYAIFKWDNRHKATVTAVINTDLTKKDVNFE